MALVSQSDRGNPTCYTVVVPFPLILLARRSDWAGRWERKMRRQRLWPYFPFYRLLHRKRYWKPFMPHLWFPLFHPLTWFGQLLGEGALDTGKHMMSVSCLYVGLSLKYKSVVCQGQYLVQTLIHNVVFFSYGYFLRAAWKGLKKTPQKSHTHTHKKNL